MIAQTHLDALGRLLGAAGLIVDPAAKAAYETGARHDQGKAAFVARPRSTAEVSAVVGYCVREAIPLIPQSGNTGLVAGSTPDASGAQGIVSLDRLTEIRDLDRVNRTVRAGAGVLLSDLNDRTSDAGLFFPIDLGANPRLGGMISTNTGGARFLRYGDVRRNTLGLTVVLADAAGTVLELSGPLRKNNTGIDWKQLFIGTSGAFGVVTECILNLELLPEQTATALLVPSSSASVPALLVAMEEAFGSNLSTFEGMSGNAIRAAFRHVPGLSNPFAGGSVPDFVVLLEVARSPRAGEQSLEAALQEVLAPLWDGDNPLVADAFVGPPLKVWALRHALSEGVKASGRLVAFDLAFRRGDVMVFLDRIKAEIPRRFPGFEICDFGHIGDGAVHLNLVLAKNDPRLPDAAFEQALREWVVAICVDEFGGSFSAEHGIGRKNQHFYDRYTPTDIRRLSAALKGVAAPGLIGAVRL